jgi:hypothetical protein
LKLVTAESNKQTNKNRTQFNTSNLTCVTRLGKGGGGGGGNGGVDHGRDLVTVGAPKERLGEGAAVGAAAPP